MIILQHYCYLLPGVPLVSATRGALWEKGMVSFPVSLVFFLSSFESTSEEQTALSGSWVTLPVPAGSVQICFCQMAASRPALCSWVMKRA